MNFQEENDRVASAVISRVSAKLKQYGNNPASKFFQGMDEIVRCIHAMSYPDRDKVANSDFDFKNTICLSCLPCGAGKTTTLIETIRFLMEDPSYDDAGFIVFLSKLSEIDDITSKIGLDEKDFSVVVHPSRDVFKKGNQVKRNARVMFTTQQMLSRLSMGSEGRKKFSEISDYYFKGRPRHVRVWDEACLPATIRVINRDDLDAARQYIRKMKNGVALAEEVDRFSVELYGKEDNELIEIPDLSEYVSDVQEALGAIKYDDFKESVQSLFAIQGMTARVRKKEGLTALQYEDALPSDIAPMLILDASGRNRTTYDNWLQGRKGIYKLQSPAKSYEGLTVKHWDNGAGKNAQSKTKKKYKELALGVVREIDRIPRSESILCVVHKQGFYQPDMEKEIREQLTTSGGNLTFTTWGKHSASNEWRDCNHVFLVGLQYYNAAQYDALVKGSLGESIETPSSKEQMDYIMKGELALGIEQAAGRGKSRLLIGDSCPENCNLYLIYAIQEHAGITGEALMQQVFPDCAYEEWTPVRTLQGRKQQELADFITAYGGKTVDYKTLMDRCGIPYRKRLMDMLNDIEPYLRQERGVYIRVDEDRLLIGKRPPQPKRVIPDGLWSPF